MVADNLHLHFLPRSLQLNMSKINNTDKPSKSTDRGASNPRPTDNKKKKRKIEEDGHAIEEEYSSPLHRKKKKTQNFEISEEPNKHLVCFSELDDLIAGFLSSRGLSNTLSTFLKETQHELTGKTHKGKLEDVYHFYCNQIHGSATKLNTEEGEADRDKTFGKPHLDANLNGGNTKRKDNKRKCRKNDDAHAAKILILTSNGSHEAKTLASEKDLQLSDKSKDSGTEALDDFCGYAKRKKTEKDKNNSEMVIKTHKGSVKILSASNELEQVVNHSDLSYEAQKLKGEKKKKKKAASDKINLTDKDAKNGSKKTKKVRTFGKDVQPMKSHALHGEAAQGRTTDSTQDLEYPTNIEVSKKEKKKNRKTKLDDTSPRDDGFGETSLEITMALRKLQAIGSNTAKRESNIQNVEDLSEVASKCPYFEVSKEDKKKSPQMNLGDNNKQNNNKKSKKEKKALEKSQVTLNGKGAKGVWDNLSEDICYTQRITQAHEAFETNQYLIGECVALEKFSADTISQKRSTSGKEDYAKETEEHVSPKSKKDKHKKPETGMVTPTTKSKYT